MTVDDDLTGVELVEVRARLAWERGRWIAELLDTARSSLARVERFDRRVDGELVAEAVDALRQARDLMDDHRRAADEARTAAASTRA